MIEDIDSHDFHAGERLLLDANIWLFTYGPISYRRQNNASAYNNALAKISINSCEVYICQTIISEFINRCIDEEFKLLKIDRSSRKAARKIPTIFEPIAKKIALYMQDILDLARCCNSPFDSAKIRAYLKDFQTGNLDYNDIIIEDICKVNNLTLVTDDSDFENCNIQILTANDYMLRH